ncbi:dual specificity protein phosphatase 18 isoform X2 [Oryzias melastigma]|uniref:dual specificity protein phosphatase 18 isoform X2 n=1 Tax=Oryzias melastigma TaxID=30732 RepID=UPI000CF7CAF3|nr:dual specificity protein phosphatase 18 isoform X2 [Oryzias melastigma]
MFPVLLPRSGSDRRPQGGAVRVLTGPACGPGSAGVMRVSQVSARLFLSDLDSALNPSVLVCRNVTLVVNASGLQDLSYPPLEGLHVLQVPVQDRPHAPLKDHFEQVAERIQHNRAGSTLVHCTAGRSRSPALVMAYLMRSEGLSLCQAHQLVLEQRPFIRPNSGFWRQLMEYELVLFGRNSVRMAETACGVLPEVLHNPEGPDSSEGYFINM